MKVPAALAVDGRSLDALRVDAGRDPQATAKKVATQFEALFMQMVLKSMRDSVPKSGLFDGVGADVYQGMLDTQFAQAMTGQPRGLSDQIARQLLRSMRLEGPSPDAPDALPAPPALPRTVPVTALRQVSAAAAPPTPVQPAPSDTSRAATPERSAVTQSFVDRMWPAAERAQQSTGVPAGFIVGQAALETGWGRNEIRHADGRSSHNLFGIKAGPGWKGETVDALTTEWVNGKPVKSVEKFRSYGSYEEAFGDWARLMTQQPRYARVIEAGGSIEGFAANLHRAGYATDPDYASKLTRTITQALGARRISL